MDVLNLNFYTFDKVKTHIKLLKYRVSWRYNLLRLIKVMIVIVIAIVNLH